MFCTACIVLLGYGRLVWVLCLSLIGVIYIGWWVGLLSLACFGVWSLVICFFRGVWYCWFGLLVLVVASLF